MSVQARIRIGYKWLVRNSAFSGTTHEFTWATAMHLETHHEQASVFLLADAEQLIKRVGGEIDVVIYHTPAPPLTLRGMRKLALASSAKKPLATRTIAERIAINRRAKRARKAPFTQAKLT